MRMVIIGGGSLASHCAAELTKRDHEVVIIEKDQDKIDVLSEYIDCGFILGDGAKPKFLEEACAKNTDALICLSDSDTDNLLAAQVAKTMGFKRVIVRVEDDELEPVCHNLEMDGVIFTNKQLTREIVNMSEMRDGMLRSAYLDGDLQFVELTLDENCPKSLADAELPKQCQLVTVNSGDKCSIPADVKSLNAGDKLLFVSSHKNLERLRESLGLTSDS
ncbi:potassium channel family protein [Colwellia polaris]|jgi:trk system potassium uptake protein TrkA|uniref:potassium channel family protein n=1 Tax=Colwellia polaris TaxID=326537 RepID=UPI000A1749E0|nr:TrkA family potassium uptake protein [Colwellia polaris]